MTLLIPELERQLRAVVRAELEAGHRRRRPAPGVLVVAFGAVVAIAVAVFAVAVLSAGRHAAISVSSGGAARYASPCLGRPPSAAGAYAAVASGSLDGHQWTLLARRGAPGYQGVLRGRVVIDGRSDAFCPGMRHQFSLIALAPKPVVYGYAAVPRVAQVQLESNPGGRNVIRPRVMVGASGGTFYLAEMPVSVCQGKVIGGVAAEITALAAYEPTGGPSTGPASSATPPMEADFGEEFGPCTAGQIVPIAPPPPRPATPGPPAGLSGSARAQFLRGQQVADQAGCEACHQLGAAGNNGPGPNLTDVGKRLPSAAIRAALLNPVPPMPSFRHLSPGALRALVAYLSELRGQR